MPTNDHRNRRFSRRSFLGIAGSSLAALLVDASSAPARSKQAGIYAGGYGELVPDPNGILDLPQGFQYRIISSEEAVLSDGRPIPGDFDGMAAFPGPGGTTILVRNHELKEGDSGAFVVGTNPYNVQGPGGTTGIIVGPDRKKVKEFVTSSGSYNNCAGGPTPWGTWLTCEEARTTNHGYVFEVMPNAPENDLSKTPIRAMGYFSHEAVAVDSKTGIVYLTEDDFRGEIPDNPQDEVVGQTRVSFLYRYIPNDRRQQPGALQAGGTLQVLTLQEQSAFNTDLANPRQRFGVVWVDVNPEEPHDDAEAKGGARFNRLEGVSFAGGALWFSDTAGGEKRLGQIFRYRPATETLELFFESSEMNQMESPDNVVVAPWGDLWFVEDSDVENRVMGITPEGAVYKFASNRLNDSELAGPCFSPDGQTFFVNIQDPGITFAIWGPFMMDTTWLPFVSQSATRQRALAYAAPPAHFAPLLSGELAEAAVKYELSALEAAAYQRLGVPLL